MNIFKYFTQMREHIYLNKKKNFFNLQSPNDLVTLLTFLCFLNETVLSIYIL